MTITPQQILSCVPDWLDQDSEVAKMWMHLIASTITTDVSYDTNGNVTAVSDDGLLATAVVTATLTLKYCAERFDISPTELLADLRDAVDALYADEGPDSFRDQSPR